MKLTIAIYSGEIPSTSFIERLIEGLAVQELTVLLFGKLRGTKIYKSPNIKVIGNQSGISGWVQALFRIMRLRFTEPKRFSKLKDHLGTGPFSSLNGFASWQKYVPVLLHLPDIFHVQWAKSAGEWVFLKGCFNVRLVLSLRGTHITVSPLVDQALAVGYGNAFPHYDAFHAVSHSMVKLAETFGADAQKCHIIYSGLPPVLMVENKSFRPTRLLAVGRFHWIKGYNYLIDALRILKDERVDVRLTLVAHGEMQEEILFQLHELGLEHLVTWKKGLLPHEVSSQMKEHDLLVLSSVEEGIANVVIEAMNVGLPVISTDCGGMGEVIEDSINGFLVPARNPKAIANAIVRFMEMSGVEVDLIRKEAQQTIRRQFGGEKSIDAFTSLYRQVAG